MLMMLKTYFKDSFGFAIRCIWIVVIIIPSLWVFLEVLHSAGILSKMDLPAWVQAIGSILAIFYSVRIANAQHKKNIELRYADEVAQYQKLVGYAAFVIAGMKETVSLLKSRDSDVTNLKRHISILEESASVLKEVGIDSIKNLDLSITWIQLRHVLSDFINEALKEGTVEAIVRLRLHHMERSVQRAEELESEMLVASENL
jgi:hypothetical protein